VEKLLRVVPKSLRQVAVAIQVSADLSTLTLEDTSGRLRAAQEADAEDDEAPPPRADGKLYLTWEQWEAQARREKVERGDSSSAGGGSKSGARWGHARRAPTGSGGDTGPGQKLAKDQCRRCRKTDHWARECPTKPKNQAAHLAQAEDEEATLLMARVSSIQISPTRRAAQVNASPAATPAARALEGDGVGDGGRVQQVEAQVSATPTPTPAAEAQVGATPAPTPAAKAQVGATPAPNLAAEAQVGAHPGGRGEGQRHPGAHAGGRGARGRWWSRAARGGEGLRPDRQRRPQR
jgi:hypothetical protein